MGNKIKIHEIAKKIGVSSKDVLEKAKALGAINYFVKNNFKQTTFVKQIKEVLSK